MTPTFWKWALYAFTGLIVLSMLDGKTRQWAIAVIVLGGLAYAYRLNPNVYKDLGNMIKGNVT